MWVLTHVTWPDSYRMTRLVSHDPTRITWPDSYHMTPLISHDPTHVTWPDSFHMTRLMSHDPTHVTWPDSCHMTRLISHDPTHVTWPDSCHMTRLMSHDPTHSMLPLTRISSDLIPCTWPDSIFVKQNFFIEPYLPREPWWDPSNRRLYEHGIYIQPCQDSNSQPVPFHVTWLILCDLGFSSHVQTQFMLPDSIHVNTDSLHINTCWVWILIIIWLTLKFGWI